MPSLGLYVLTKNCEATLPAALQSARGLVDSMVVVDTGSSDGTLAIAQGFGATVVHFPWGGDFAAARNAGIAALETDWILVLDADEELDEGAHAWIPGEIARPTADGYIVPVRNYQKPGSEAVRHLVPVPGSERHPRAPDASSYVPSEVCRLFRRTPGIYYVGPVHEQVEYRMLALGRPIGRAGFFIHHFGWYLLEAEAVEQKHSLYRELLRQKLASRPEDVQVLLQYGDALCYFGEHAEGLACFLKAASLAPERGEIWVSVGWALLRQGHVEAAEIASRQIPDTPEHRCSRAHLRGEVFAAAKRWPEAVAAYAVAAAGLPDVLAIQAKLALLELEAGEQVAGNRRIEEVLATLDQAARNAPSAARFLAVAELYGQLRRFEQSLFYIRQGLAFPGQRPAIQPLQELRLRAATATGQHAEAAEAAHALSLLCPSVRSFLREAALLAKAGEMTGALAAIERGLCAFPGAPELTQAGTELRQERDGRAHALQESAGMVDTLLER